MTVGNDQDRRVADLDRRVADFEKILDVTRALGVTVDLDPLLVQIATAATDVLDCERATVFLCDHAKHELFSRIATGMEGAPIEEIRFGMDRGIAGEVATTGKGINIPDPYNDSRFNPDFDRKRELYRRENLRCVACHRIDREGGRVGPNLTAIGSAAQSDYLLDSLLDPAKNVKEGYGSLVVVTADGQVTSGIPVSRSDTELVLRDSLDKDVRLQLADIEEEAPGTSLMPAGLVDDLSAEDLADLVRYLSSLGR